MNKLIYSLLFFTYTALFSSSIFAIEDKSKKIQECEVALTEKYIEVLQDCIQDIPENNIKDIAKFKGFIAHKTGKYERAEGFYIEFLQINENINEEIKYSILLGNLYVHQANFYEAVNYYSIAFKLNKIITEKEKSSLNLAKIKMGLSNIFYYLNVKTEVILEYKEIIQILEKLNTKESKHLLNEVYFLLSTIYSNMNNSVQAELYADQALKIADESDYLLGMGYAKKALSYAYIFSKDQVKIDKANFLILESEEIFNILDIQDEIIFNLEIMKIKIMIEEKKYSLARKEIMELEIKYTKNANNYNQLTAIYELFYNLYMQSNNKAAALRYKWKEIEVNEEIRNEQNTHIVLTFKNKFKLAETDNKNQELVISTIEKENEILASEKLNESYNKWIYLALSLILVLLLIFIFVVFRRKNLLISKIKEDTDLINLGKEAWGEGYFLRKKEINVKERYALIGFKIPSLEEDLSDFSIQDVNSFNLFIENTIKSQLRKGDVLFKKSGRILILSKANLDESYFVALRLKKALKSNKYIKDNIYFAAVNAESKDGIEENIKEIDIKIEKGIKKDEKIKI